MKKIATFIAILLLILASNSSYGQFKDKIDNYLSYFEEDYESSKLDEEYQYFRQLTTLRNKAIWKKALKFKSKETFSNENSYYYDRHQVQ